ncbi:MAG: hypothetical protein A3F72_15980 [Bacteroidetes bacterium RIFCSPLOWO2_12_FULL_35_15]|nr:MAG: hypothetical protein A3F72_15980 [Bacteroidetes bacterium RIFCSPLOWO2_12_FULL_35_15]
MYANITSSQANDTIIAYGNNPWFVILDVRTPSEYATTHLSEGVNIDYYSATFAATLATLNKSKVYLLHCASGGRSGQVYTMMQNLHFRRVYNMIGGTNAWTSAGFPGTTFVAPVVGALCDTNSAFVSTPLNQTDSIQLTITNAANSVLSFTGITGISGTDFTTNFNTGESILGARDYSFNVYYTPTDLISDNTIFSIQSNGGIINFYLSGTASAATGINNSAENTFSIYNDNVSHVVSFNLNNVKNSPSIISIVDVNGKLVYEQQHTGQLVSVDYSTWKSNMYFLRITENGISKTYKLPLIR